MQTSQNISGSLWEALNKLRGSLEVTEYKNYLLPFLYYCYISKMIKETLDNELENDELTYEEAWDYTEDGEYTYRQDLIDFQLESFGVVIEPQYLADNINDTCGYRIKTLDEGWAVFIDLFSEAITSFEENCNPSFRGTMGILDLNSARLGDDPDTAGYTAAYLFTMSRNIVNSLPSGTEADVVGDVYEKLMGYFASSAGKKGGEFFTPKEMSKLVAKLATHDMQHVKAISDPTCGSGSLLLQAAKEIRNNGFNFGDLYGQEKNNVTSKLAKINMAIHKVSTGDFEINCCDTLGEDIYPDAKYDVTVANPPYSVEWNNGEYRYNDDRFAGYGALAPAKTATLP